MNTATFDVTFTQVDIAGLAPQLEANAQNMRSKERFGEVASIIQSAVDSFRSRAAARGLAQYKIEEVVLIVSHMLTATSSKVRYEDKVLLALQMLVHASDPSTITSRGFSTSFAAAYEYLLYLNNPEILVAMLAATLITGKCSSPTGRTVRIERENRLPINGCDQSLEPTNRRRSYASQMAQTIITCDLLKSMDAGLNYLVTPISSEAQVVGMTSGHLLYCPEARRPEADRLFEAVFCNDVCIGALGNLPPLALIAQMESTFVLSVVLCGSASLTNLYDFFSIPSPVPTLAFLKLGDEITAHVALGFSATDGLVSLWNSSRGFHVMPLHELHTFMC